MRVLCFAEEKTSITSVDDVNSVLNMAVRYVCQWLRHVFLSCGFKVCVLPCDPGICFACSAWLSVCHERVVCICADAS